MSGNFVSKKDESVRLFQSDVLDFKPSRLLERRLERGAATASLRESSSGRASVDSVEILDQSRNLVEGRDF